MAERYKESKPFKNPAKEENAPFDDPADDQVEAEAFDEDKHLGREDQRRPATGDADPGKVPVDEGIPGGRGERFGEQLPRTRETTDALDEVSTEQERLAETLQKKESTPEKPETDKEILDEEEKVEEASKESFPASDSPSFTPGKPK